MVSFLVENDDDDDDERFSLCRRRMWKNPRKGRGRRGKRADRNLIPTPTHASFSKGDICAETQTNQPSNRVANDAAMSTPKKAS